MTEPALAENVRGKGRHYRNPATGELVPSVTNVLSVMGKGDVLMRWAAKMVAERAMVLKHALPNMDDGDIVDSLKAVPFQRSNRAAERGTDIHEYLEHALNGWALPELSPDAEPYRAAADAWLEHHEIEVVETEQTMFHPLYAGTADLVAYVDGKLTIADFKTSKAIYDEAALQLAALFGCGTDQEGAPLAWRYESGEFAEIPDLLVVRIGADGFQEKVVADPLGNLRVFFALLDAWNWKHSKAYL